MLRGSESHLPHVVNTCCKLTLGFASHFSQNAFIEAIL